MCPCDVAAENYDTAFVRAVFVDTIAFRDIRQCVENRREGVRGFAGLCVGDDFDKDAFIRFEL